jgi:hypothetical protein
MDRELSGPQNRFGSGCEEKISQPLTENERRSSNPCLVTILNELPWRMENSHFFPEMNHGRPAHNQSLFTEMMEAA